MFKEILLNPLYKTKEPTILELNIELLCHLITYYIEHKNKLFFN